MFVVASFGLVMRIFIVYAMIFIKKMGLLIQDQFLRIVKNPQYDNFGYVDKIIQVCFFDTFEKD